MVTSNKMLLGSVTTPLTGVSQEFVVCCVSELEHGLCSGMRTQVKQLHLTVYVVDLMNGQKKQRV